jgi:hypothetical protein
MHRRCGLLFHALFLFAFSACLLPRSLKFAISTSLITAVFFSARLTVTSSFRVPFLLSSELQDTGCSHPQSLLRRLMSAPPHGLTFTLHNEAAPPAAPLPANPHQLRPPRLRASRSWLRPRLRRLRRQLPDSAANILHRRPGRGAAKRVLVRPTRI